MNRSEAEFPPEDHAMMSLALVQARRARDLGEVPIGAVVACEGQVIAQAHNLRETLKDPTAHAERLVLTASGLALGSWRLDRCTLYVTLEPCAMCAGAIILARVPRTVYAAPDPKAGACRSLYRLLDDPRLNHRSRVAAGLMAAESGQILTAFFASRRSGRLAADSEGCLSG